MIPFGPVAADIGTIHGPHTDWSMLLWRSSLAADYDDPVIYAIAGALTLAVLLACVLTNRPSGRPRWPHRWATRVLLGLVAAATAVATMAAALPHRPVAAPTSSFHARAAAADALAGLVADYRPDAGLWDTVSGEPGWWQSAVALDDLIAAERALGTHAYDALLTQTYRQTPVAYLREFVRWQGPYYDDSGWWGVMWLDAYRWTGQRRYLVAAEGVADWLERGRTASCGGGVEWGDAQIRRGSQKNAITDELVTTLDAGLYQVRHHPADLRRALASWRSLRGTGLVQPGRLVADHLDAHCHPVGVRWSYTQGLAIRAGLALTDATGDPGYRRTAASVADTATTSRSLNRHGILHEPCAPDRCGHNGAFFAGPYATALAEIGGHDAYLVRQAESAYRNDRMVGDRYGLQWSGPPDLASAGRQASAVALLTAVLSGGRA